MQAFIKPFWQLGAYDQIAEKLKKNKGVLWLSGCVDSQKVHAACALWQGYSQRLIVTYSEQKAKEIYEDCRYFDRKAVLYQAKDFLFFHADMQGNLLVQPEQGHIYAWDTFRTKVLTEKVGCLQSFFGRDNAEHGNALLYNLLALLREAENDRINLARYAYLLARLSPKKSAPDYPLYKQFSHSMMDWALDAVQRHQLITAIYIYVYQNRKGGDTDGRME